MTTEKKPTKKAEPAVRKFPGKDFSLTQTDILYTAQNIMLSKFEARVKEHNEALRDIFVAAFESVNALKFEFLNSLPEHHKVLVSSGEVTHRIFINLIEGSRVNEVRQFQWRCDDKIVRRDTGDLGKSGRSLYLGECQYYFAHRAPDLSGVTSSMTAEKGSVTEARIQDWIAKSSELKDEMDEIYDSVRTILTTLKKAKLVWEEYPEIFPYLPNKHSPVKDLIPLSDSQKAAVRKLLEVKVIA